MAPIGKKQIIESDEIKKAFEDVNAAATALTGQLSLLAKEGADLAKVLLTQKTTTTDNAKAAKEYEKILQEQAKTEKQLTEVERVKLKLSNEVAASTAKQTKESEKAAKAAAQEASAYSRLSKQHTEARNKAKDLAAQYGVNSKEARKAADAANHLDKQLKKIDGSLGQHQRNVGNYGKAWQGLGRGLMGAFGITVGLATIGKAMTDAFKKQVEFEKGLSSLSSITGLAGKQLQDLGKKAKQMSKDSTVSAVDTLKAMELIGSAKPDLLKSSEALAAVTKEAITLSEAAGMELPDAAEALTDAMNQFGLGAEDAARVINVLAAGSKEGAVAIPQVTQAMKEFGTVAKGANISIEQSTALIEALGERGIKGAEAGTKLRNFLITLQAGARETNPAIVGLSTALSNLQKQNLSTTEATKLFGKENVVAAQILMQSVPTIDRLTTAVTGTNTAYEQAAINTDNFAGASKRLGNAWDGLLLSFSGTEFAKKAVNGLTEALNTLAYAMKSEGEKIQEGAESLFQKFYPKEAKTTEEKIKGLQKVLGAAQEQYNALTEESKKAREEFGLWESFKSGAVMVGSLGTSQTALEATIQNTDMRAKKMQSTISMVIAEITRLRNLAPEAAPLVTGVEGTETTSTGKTSTATAKPLGTIRTPEALPYDPKQLEDMLKTRTQTVVEYTESETDAYLAEITSRYEQEQALAEENARRQAEIKQQWADIGFEGLNMLSDTFFANEYDRIDAKAEKEIEALQERLDNEKLSEKQREEIQKQIAKKEKKIKREAAKKEKEAALFQAFVNGVLAAGKVMATTPPAAWIGLLPFVAATAAVQIASISARKLPEYATGTDYHSGGLAVVGDGGEHELAILPSGKTILTPNTDTVMNLPRGTKVVPGDGVAQHLTDMTRQELMQLAINGPSKEQNDAYIAGVLEKELGKVRKAVENNKPQDIRAAVAFEMMRFKMKN